MLRLTAGISLREMAKKINVSPAYLSQVERGNRPPPTYEHIEHIAGILGVSKSIFQEMVERPDPAILNMLQNSPELAQFIHAASEKCLDAKDFRNMIQVLNELGKSGFQKLLKYGLSHSSDFHSHFPLHEHRSESIHEQYQEILEASFRDGLIFPNLKQKNKSRLILYLLKKACRLHPHLNADSLYGKIMQRENETTSGLGNGVAVPHLISDEIRAPILVLGKVPHGIAFDSVDSKPVRIVSLILDNTQNFEFHLKLLAAIAGKIQQPHFMKEVMKADSKEKMFELFTESISLDYL